MKPFVPSSQRNVPVLRRSLLSLAVVGALLGVQQAEAGAFAVPTYGTPVGAVPLPVAPCGTTIPLPPTTTLLRWLLLSGRLGRFRRSTPTSI